MGKLKHGQARKGAKTRTYRLWESMHRRCYMPSQDSYHLYGGRGIKVHQQWHTFSGFLNDMGHCPDGLSLDRIEVGKDYEPGNCRWATAEQQARNKRSNHRITYNGETLTLIEWAERMGLKWRTLRARLEDYRWPLERALTAPLVRGRPRA